MKVLAFVLLFCSVSLYAKIKHAPLPDAMMQAKTLYILNETGSQDDTDSAYGAFQKWGRFTITQNKDSADLIARFRNMGGGDDGPGSIEMEIYLKGQDDAAFQTTRIIRFVPFTHHDISAGQCVADFEKRLSQE